MKRSNILLAALLVLVVFRSFFFEGLATKSLYDFDEARYAEIAKNIIKTGNWLIPMASGPDDPGSITVTNYGSVQLHPYFWKPPLHTWIIAISYKILGICELAVRLPSLIFSLLSLILIYLISLRLFPHSKLTGIVTVLLLASTNDFSYISSQGIAEAQLMFFSLTAIFLLFNPTPRNIIFSGIAISLAFMTKSFAVFWVYPLALTILHHQKHLNIKSILFWISPQILLVLPWHLYMYSQFGFDFINHYVLTNTIGRGTGAQSNIAPVYWYIKYALWQWKSYLLILPILILPLINVYKKNFSNILLLVIWMILIFIPYSLIKSKVWWYIFPFWIPFCILLSYLSTALVDKYKKIALAALIVLLIGTNYLTIKQSLSRTDWNQGLKHLSLAHPNLTNLSVYKIPYESPLFYFNTVEISRKIDDSTEFVITNKDYFSELIDTKKWKVQSWGGGSYLLSRM